MNISSVTIQQIVAQNVGNILKKEGIDASRPAIECTPQTQKHLGRLINKLLEKGTPYIERKTDSGFSILDVFSSALENKERFLKKILDLGSRLYETGDHLQIPASTFLALSFEGKDDDGEIQRGVALLAFANAAGNLAYKYDERGRSLDYVETISESTLDRAAVWTEGANKVLVIDKKNVPVKHWIERFLLLKPVMTERKAALAATQLITKVSEHIDSSQKSTEYKQKVKEMLENASSVSFGEIEEFSKNYLDQETLSGIRQSLEEQTNLSLKDEYELPADTLHQKVKQFVKTIRLTPKLDVTIKGRQEVVSMEQLSSDEADTILIKLKLKEEE